MSEEILKISDDFWNIRGVFKIGGLLNVGTHSSLVRLSNGNFVLLDSYTLSGKIEAAIDEQTDHGEMVEAIVNLHPFHTVHVARVHEQFPHAKLYGTQRHLDKFPELPWEPERAETSEFAALFDKDLEFSVPEGVDFISSNEHYHFASVLAYHPASKTIHADDTLMYMPLPGPLGILKSPEVTFHITLSRTLQKRAGAAAEFRNWAQTLADKWHDAETLCAAHSAARLASRNSPLSVADSILRALEKVEKTLSAHEQKYG